jgi:hypothetical protein
MRWWGGIYSDAAFVGTVNESVFSEEAVDSTIRQEVGLWMLKQRMTV